MPRLPIFKPRALIRVLRELGFVSVRQKGSHEMFEHPDGRTTEVPHHGGKDIGNKLMHQILHEIEMTPEEFAEYL